MFRLQIKMICLNMYFKASVKFLCSPFVFFIPAIFLSFSRQFYFIFPPFLTAEMKCGKFKAYYLFSLWFIYLNCFFFNPKNIMQSINLVNQSISRAIFNCPLYSVYWQCLRLFLPKLFPYSFPSSIYTEYIYRECLNVSTNTIKCQVFKASFFSINSFK